ncbi:DUF4373 domain-containing protein [Sporomusa sp. KB1]|jgi:hypothetical protein|uniref:DUF4373 domain-containing protein n=1 Tax=Sporomusa sp. KB1 TaxID=943346 RepID=UPI0011A59E27|nr:DUF4373 domain-containing protein [Sporomusa sp. KB1]TWH48523.1 uncharacterized protein DUF4373 [Sporomusa sp. KB1]
MARPNKEGLDYFSLDTDITGDDKIKLIKAKHGLVGFAIVILLLTKIYKEGYYYHWSEDEQYLFADDARVDINTVITIVNDCINRGFFNQKLYDKYGILTSRGIQKRFLQGCARRKKLVLIREYFIADDHLEVVFENKKINVTFKSINVSNNPVNAELMSAEIPQIEIEIEREKEIESNAREGELVDNFSPNDFLEGIALAEGSVRNAPDTDVNGEVAAALEREPDFVNFWNVYPKHGNESIAIEAWNTLLSQGVEAKHLILAANKYAAKVRLEKTEAQFIKYAHNFLLQGVYRDYLPLQVTRCPKCKDYHRCKGQEWFWQDEPDGRGGTKQVTVICPYKAGVQNASIGA